MNQKKSRIADVFARLSEKGERAFIPFITAGDPDFAMTRELLYRLKEAGADIVELGIPYSDPLADGPVIQAAALRSLAAGTTLPQVFEFVKDLRQEGFDLPILLFTYINPVMQYGFERFFAKTAECGADGAIIPDLPFEEADEALAAAASEGLDLIPLIAPTSAARIERICKRASGFVYCVATLGVTGARDRISEGLPGFVENVRKYAPVPVAVGFGVSNGDQAREISGYADGIIVGSALVRKVGEIVLAKQSGDGALLQNKLEEFSAFARSLKDPLRG